MAGKSLEALALMGIGYRSFSVPGPSAGQLKKMILSTPLKETESFFKEALNTHSPSLRKSLTNFAKCHKICLD